MNKYSGLFLFILSFALLSACQPKKSVPAVDEQPADTTVVQSLESLSSQRVPSYATANKGKIEAVREIPVFSRISEQIVMFGVEKAGQQIKKGQVVVRLSEDAIRENILHSRARLEKAEFQYQAILMGQGYKLAHLEDAPENIKQLARINSGYNEAMAELHELEHTLSYCSIVAPISGAVSQICNTLYGAAQPGEALFYIVDTEHLKVGFDVLENELAKYQMGVGLSVTTVAYPDERHTAKVSAISPVIDDNGMVHIEALLEPHPHLMPGMTAFVTLISTPQGL